MIATLFAAVVAIEFITALSTLFAAVVAIEFITALRQKKASPMIQYGQEEDHEYPTT